MFDRLRIVIRDPDREEILRRKVATYLSRFPTPGRAREKKLDALASRMVWIFGTGRNGSTWTARMLSDSGPRNRMWNEPLVGAMFGDFYYGRALDKVGPANILSPKYRETWLPLMRNFVLESAFARYPEVAGSDGYLFVKEPNGSLGSTLLTAALPESRVILLVRDPRDSVASKLDARGEGGWLKVEERPSASRKRELLHETRQNAARYRQGISRSLEAYRGHRGPKSLVSYEEIRSDPLATLSKVASELGLSLDRSLLEKSVEKHSWENIPEDQKGSGKKYRKATSGGWREDLSPAQIKAVERITGPLMDEFGYTRHST